MMPFNEQKPRSCGCNIHIKIITALIRGLHGDFLIRLLDNTLRPLPQWMQAILSTLFISVVPIIFIYVINIGFQRSQGSKEVVVIYGIAFATGGLLGDVFFHTLPHLSAGGHDHGHDHGHHEQQTLGGPEDALIKTDTHHDM